MLMFTSQFALGSHAKHEVEDFIPLDIVVTCPWVLSCSMFQRPPPPVLTDDGTSLTVVARYPWTGVVVVTN